MRAEVEQTKLFTRLREREEADGLSAGELSALVLNIVAEAEPILGQVCRRFPEFTLHDPGHGTRVVDNMGKIVPLHTLQQLNSVELTIAILAGFLHDIGMAASADEMDSWLASEEGQSYISLSEQWGEAAQRARHDGNELVLHRIQDMAYTDYLRLGHADRSSQYINSHYGPNGLSPFRIMVREVNFAHLVARVVGSHGDDPATLRSKDFRRDELVRDYRVNLQYIGVLLRLADVTDLDPERTPKALLDFINPRDKKSADEWAKHRNIQGWEISPDRIRFRARCTHPAIQSGLREWMEYIERERSECRDVVVDNVTEVTEKYRLDLQEPVSKAAIESDGSYIFGDFRFQLDYERIVSASRSWL